MFKIVDFLYRLAECVVWTAIYAVIYFSLPISKQRSLNKKYNDHCLPLSNKRESITGSCKTVVALMRTHHGHDNPDSKVRDKPP